MLWQGLAAYIVEQRIGLLFGCASLPGTDPTALAPQLAYLRDHHLAAADLCAKPLRPVPMITAAYDPKAVLQSLPPLLKGYLRAGASIGEGAVIDQQFNTTDVLVVLRTDAIAARYSRRYEAATVRAA